MSARRLVLALLGSVVLLAGCGGDSGGGDGDVAAPRTNSSSASTSSTAISASASATAVAAPVTVAVGKSLWHAGWKLTVNEVTHGILDGDPRPAVSLDVLYGNLGADQSSFDSMLALEVGGVSIPGSPGLGAPDVPGGGTGKGKLLFVVPDGTEFDPAAAVLVVGNPENNQARIPLAGTGAAQTLEPLDLSLTGTATIPSRLEIKIVSGELRADIPAKHDEVKKGQLALTIGLDATFLGDFAGGFAFTDDNLALELPDGTTVGADKYPIELLKSQRTMKDLSARFLVDAPGTGDYVLQVIDGELRAKYPFTVAASPVA